MSTAKPFNYASSQAVRWCPGCGDYAILSAMQRFFKTLDIPPENVCFVSGIGCNGRFPYYMNTFGFHTIHGRAPAVAQGIKMANPKLSVWLITGDGDGLSIGANHLIHLLRRDIDINVLLFNNEIYGLTKGQYSPTSKPGQKTKTSPLGGNVSPLSQLKLALGCEASFIARGLDKEPKHLMGLFEKAYEHKGTSFIEIYQNCPVFNDDAFTDIEDKKTRKDKVLFLEDGQPMRFGQEDDKQLLLQGESLAVDVKLENTGLNHNASSRVMADRLLHLDDNAPLPLGVIYQRQRTLVENSNDTPDALTEASLDKFF